MEENSSVSTRIALLRKKLNLTQSQFAKKIGIAQNSYSLIETGKNALTEQNIKLICLTFAVNENWLRTGEGDMFIADKKETQQQERFIKLFERLNSNMQNVVIKHLQNLVEEQEVQEN